MSKAAAGLGILGLGTTTAVAAPLAVTLSGGSGGKLEDSDISPKQINKVKFQEPTWTKSFPRMTSAKDIQSSYKNINCLSRHYGTTIDWNNKQALATNFNTNFLGTENEKWGCLVVEYVEQKYEQNKWWGEFRLMWSLSDSKQGLITVVNVKVTEGKLKGSSTSYLMRKENDKWSTKYAQENEEQEITTAEDLKKIIPKAGSSIKEGGYKKTDYWGFDPQFNNICGTDECLGTPTSKTEESVTWKLTHSNSGIKMNFWCDNLKRWFDENFKWNNFSYRMESVNGDWTKESSQ